MEHHPDLPALPQRAFCTRLGEDTAPELQRAERLGWFVNTVIIHDPDAEAGPHGGWHIDDCVRYCFVQKPREVAYVWELLKRFWVPTPSWVDVNDIERSLDPEAINDHRRETEPQPTRMLSRAPKTVGELVDKLSMLRRDLPLTFMTTHGHRLEWFGMAGTDNMELLLRPRG